MVLNLSEKGNGRRELVQFEKNDSYQGIASAMPPKGMCVQRL